MRFKDYGMKSIEVIDNGSGIAEKDYDSIGELVHHIVRPCTSNPRHLALNHHTSKLSSFSSLTTLTSFGFRGEALSSLCALCESVSVTTATECQKGVGYRLEMGKMGKTVKKSVVARQVSFSIPHLYLNRNTNFHIIQRGTTVTLTNPFQPLPVRRKEFERNHKREYGKAMNLLTAYALVPCVSNTNPTNSKSKPKGVRLSLTNTLSCGKKQMHILAPGGGADSMTVASGLWGVKGLEGVKEFEVEFAVEPPKAMGSALHSSTAPKYALKFSIPTSQLLISFLT